ncbi:hypothetical protein SMMN14_05702 [Sphaerulina musiva]
MQPTTIFTTLLLAASALVDASAINPNYAALIDKRALPSEQGCRACPNGDKVGYGEASAKWSRIDPAIVADAKESFDKTFPAGYEPQLCSQPGINCMTSSADVKWTGVGGLTARWGSWARSDGTIVNAWPHWQSTLQWAGPGGSGTTYNAHCVIFTCAKGKMQAQITNNGQLVGEVKGDGKGDNSAVNRCDCFYDLDSDIYFSLM